MEAWLKLKLGRDLLPEGTTVEEGEKGEKTLRSNKVISGH